MSTTYIRTYLLRSCSALLIIAPSMLFAQWGIGPKAGIAVAKVRDTKEDIATQSITGFVAGVSIHTSLQRTFRFEPEVLFAQKGYREKSGQFSSIGVDQAEFKCTVNYLEIPLMATIAVGKGSPRLLLQAGPYVAMALGVRTWSKVTINGTPIEGSLSGPPDRFGLEPMDMGMNLGGGMTFELGGGMFNAEARFQLGLKDIAKGSYANVHRGGMFTLAYLIPMGKDNRRPAAAPAK